MKKTEAMISVEPTKAILGFAFPLILGNVFQQLYTFIDTIIVGKMIGLEALAAVGTTEWISFLMFLFFHFLDLGKRFIFSQLRKKFFGPLLTVLIGSFFYGRL